MNLGTAVHNFTRFHSRYHCGSETETDAAPETLKRARAKTHTHTHSEKGEGGEREAREKETNVAERASETGNERVRL
jgi:hypothetical protein